MRYASDRRVRRSGRGWAVSTGAGELVVLPGPGSGWAVYGGSRLELVAAAGGGLATGYRTADEAIAAALTAV